MVDGQGLKDSGLKDSLLESCLLHLTGPIGMTARLCRALQEGLPRDIYLARWYENWLSN